MTACLSGHAGFNRCFRIIPHYYKGDSTMHLLLAVLVWSAIWAILPVELVAIAGYVYALLQILKSKFPAISGPWAIGLNVVFNIAGVLAVAKHGDLATPDFWASLILSIATSAGVHGTVRSLSSG